MINRGKFYLILMVLFIFALPYTIYGQEYSKDLIREQDSLVFDSIFKTVKVVGIGEVTHGDFTSQSLRLSLIDLLINKYSFRSICIEEHNKYVKGLNSLVQADTLASRNKIEELQLAIPKWMWKTVEFTDLIIDLNLYNLNHQQKISIYGVDTVIESFNELRFRDSVMAKKTFDYSRGNNRVIYLAHNDHISFMKGNGTWAGSFLKSLLQDDYYSIGVLFNSGCFNAFTNFGFETVCVDQPRKLNCLQKTLMDLNYSGNLIDLTLLENAVSCNTQSKSRRWSVGAYYHPRFNYYRRYPNTFSSWDAVYLSDTLRPSKSFLIPGVFVGTVTKRITGKAIRRKAKDSIYISFDYKIVNYDSLLKAEFYIIPKGKRRILYNNYSTTDFYTLKKNLNSFSISFPINRGVQEYTFGFSVYGKGNLTLSNLSIRPKLSSDIIVNDVNEFDLNLGKRFIPVEPPNGSSNILILQSIGQE